jgi:hypothetical protein
MLTGQSNGSSFQTLIIFTFKPKHIHPLSPIAKTPPSHRPVDMSWGDASSEYGEIPSTEIHS